jgi:hypothetical protein
MICPVCHKEYCDDVKPQLLFPCGHGLCNVCLELCRQHAHNKCALCRSDIAMHCPNYDFLALLQAAAEAEAEAAAAAAEAAEADAEEWKSELCASISLYVPGRVVISDALEHVSPLLVFWCHWTPAEAEAEAEAEALSSSDLLVFRSVIARLVLHKTPTEIYDWMSVLRLDTPVLMHVVQELINARRFLQTQDALWVLSMVNALPAPDAPDAPDPVVEEIELF